MAFENTPNVLLIPANAGVGVGRFYVNSLGEMFVYTHQNNLEFVEISPMATPISLNSTVRLPTIAMFGRSGDKLWNVPSIWRAINNTDFGPIVISHYNLVSDVAPQRNLIAVGSQTIRMGVYNLDNATQDLTLVASSVEIDPTIVTVNGPLTVTGDLVVNGAMPTMGRVILPATLGPAQTATGAYTDVTGASVAGFVKSKASTTIVVELQAEYYGTTVNNNQVMFGVNINGTDYDVASNFAAPQLNHFTAVGFRGISGVSAGTYTVQARWKQTAGTGNINRDANSSISFIVREET